MDLHHIDPGLKVANVSRLARDGRVNAVVAELAKCEVLCANCHRVVEAEIREGSK
jgi:predicted HNH restriction endonuclease